MNETWSAALPGENLLGCRTLLVVQGFEELPSAAFMGQILQIIGILFYLIMTIVSLVSLYFYLPNLLMTRTQDDDKEKGNEVPPSAPLPEDA